MINLLIILLCSLGFRVRGGLRIKGHKLPLNKYWFAFAFACSYCLLTKCDFNTWLVVFIASILSTQIYGWGEYLGCVLGVGTPTDERRDCDLVDDIVDTLKFNFKGKVVKLTDYPIAFGWLGTSLRGLILSFLIGLAINSIPYMLCGFSMGTIYYLCGLFARKVLKKMDKTGWNISEWVFGAYLGLILCIVI